MQDQERTPKNGQSMNQHGAAGSQQADPVVSTKDGDQVNMLNAVRMMWAIAAIVMRAYDGQLKQIPIDGVDYLCIAFPLDLWERDAEGHWIPKAGDK